ncbi:Hypothetical protein PBC10988_10220 [Planctomycetales bacterium 10988]|nr:Hypothetical protein PBC10988_10220 [Planctomycetales bacterium 10988]
MESSRKFTSFKSHRFSVFTGGVILAWMSTLPLFAQSPNEPFLTGGQLQEKLSLPTSLHWNERDYLSGLRDYFRQQQVGFLLDRRINPNQTVNLNLNRQPLELVLPKIAKAGGTSQTWLDSCAYFGPSDQAQRLATVSALRTNELQEFAPEVANKWKLQRRWSWEDLATPEELLSELEGEFQIEIRAKEFLPYDHLSGADLPPLTLVERLSLLLVQFDATFRFEADGNAITIIAFPQEATLVHRYPSGGNLQSRIETWKQAFPQAKIEPASGRIQVTGSYENHQAIRAMLNPQVTAQQSKPSSTNLQERYTLTVEQKPLAAVLTVLGKQIGFEIDWQPEDGQNPDRNQMVSFRVQDAKLEELLEALFRDTSYTFELQEMKVSVRAR